MYYYIGMGCVVVLLGCGIVLAVAILLDKGDWNI